MYTQKTIYLADHASLSEGQTDKKQMKIVACKCKSNEPRFGTLANADHVQRKEQE